jgi:glucosamine--fructose-6-phosphate aminotransferase (isomerizing)
MPTMPQADPLSPAELASSVLRTEIFSQPQVLATILERQGARVAAVAARVVARDPAVVVIVGRGSADNAGIYGKYLFGAFNGKIVALATPSLVTRYGLPPAFAHALVLAISQSGESHDVVEVVRVAREAGALTVALTNTPGSPLALAAEETLLCEAGQERSIAATKTYTAQLLLMAMLAAAMRGIDGPLQQGLAALPEQVERALLLEPQVQQVAERLRYLERCAVIGRGFCYGSAFELALKLVELTHVVAQPYSAADFRHGPIALVEPGFCVLLLAPQGQVLADLSELQGELRARRAEVIAISDASEILRNATRGLALPPGVPEWLAPLVCIVPGQLLALHLCRARGLPVDAPRGLSKVTRTR